MGSIMGSARPVAPQRQGICPAAPDNDSKEDPTDNNTRPRVGPRVIFLKNGKVLLTFIIKQIFSLIFKERKY